MKTLILSLLTVLIATLLHSCGKSDSYKLHLLFDNVDGLTTRSIVKANGLTVGTIDNMEVFKNKIIVTTTINKNTKIPKQSSFEIISADFFGAKAIEIKLDSTSTAFLRNNDTINGQVQANLLSDSTAVKLLQPLADTIANVIRGFNKTTKEKKE